MRLFLIAGEPSGDALGAALISGLRELAPEVLIDGIGGPLMRAEGLTSRFPMEELSVMGLAEVLPKYPHLRRRMLQTVDAVLQDPPDALITIDSPDFCLRVAKRVKAVLDTPTFHYVAPTVWAWRPKRAKKMVGVVDHVLALFPFEPPYMEAEGIACTFVGHPVVTAPQASEAEAAAFRAAHGISDDVPLLLALPGSRKGEVTRLAGRFGEALQRVIASRPDARVVLPMASPVTDLVPAMTRDWPGSPILLPPNAPEKTAAFRAADVALAASGTVSLELAAAGTPMVIAYDMNWLSRLIIARMLRVDTVTLVNLVSGTRAVPEFLGKDCQPGPIADALDALIDNPTVQTEAMARTMQLLGAGQEPPGLRAAKAVLDDLAARA